MVKKKKEKWLTGPEGWGKQGEFGKRVGTVSYMNKVRRSNVQCGDYS